MSPRLSRKDTSIPTSERLTKKKQKFVEEAVAKYIPILARTEKQARLLEFLRTKSLVVVTGPAGTGKTWVPCAQAADWLTQGKIDKIVFSRPTVPCGRSIGFFPGTLEEKMEPWVTAHLEVFRERAGAGAVETWLKNKTIEVIPFETMRGRTFHNAFVFLDETQNTSVKEIKMFVTRLGENTTTVVVGDQTQSDLGDNRENGLDYLEDLVLDKAHLLEEFVGFVKFSKGDVVRSGVCKAFVEAIG